MQGLKGNAQHFTPELFHKAMASTGTFRATANFFYADWRFSCTPSVPLNQTAIQALIDRDFSEPVPFPDNVMVGVVSKKHEIEKHLGAWKRATPEELIYAYILAVVRDVTAATKKTDRRPECTYFALSWGPKLAILQTPLSTFKPVGPAGSCP